MECQRGLASFTTLERCRFKEVLQTCVVLISYSSIYRDLEYAIKSADVPEDLKWFKNNHGPGMTMNWPQFEVRTSFNLFIAIGSCVFFAYMIKGTFFYIYSHSGL